MEIGSSHRSGAIGLQSCDVENQGATRRSTQAQTGQEQSCTSRDSFCSSQFNLFSPRDSSIEKITLAFVGSRCDRQRRFPHRLGFRREQNRKLGGNQQKNQIDARFSFVFLFSCFGQI